jgi:hypothetical protein
MVIFGGEEEHKVVSKRIIILVGMSYESYKDIHNIFHIPIVIKNLLVVSQVTNMCLYVKFNESSCKIEFYDEKVIAKVVREGNLYTICEDV